MGGVMGIYIKAGIDLTPASAAGAPGVYIMAVVSEHVLNVGGEDYLEAPVHLLCQILKLSYSALKVRVQSIKASTE